MSWAGAANIQNGVTIDLSAMNTVTVSDDQQIASVGAGARWQDVYLKLDAMNLAVSGGRVNDVGVAGLTLGGTCYSDLDRSSNANYYQEVIPTLQLDTDSSVTMSKISRYPQSLLDPHCKKGALLTGPQGRSCFWRNCPRQCMFPPRSLQSAQRWDQQLRHCNAL